MPDVSIDNTIVQENLASNETVTVPSGESWDVTLLPEPSIPEVLIDGAVVIDPDSSVEVTPTVDTVLHEGDVVKSNGDVTRIRGWVVRS